MEIKLETLEDYLKGGILDIKTFDKIVEIVKGNDGILVCGMKDFEKSKLIYNIMQEKMKLGHNELIILSYEESMNITNENNLNMSGFENIEFIKKGIEDKKVFFGIMHEIPLGKEEKLFSYMYPKLRKSISSDSGLWFEYMDVIVKIFPYVLNIEPDEDNNYKCKMYKMIGMSVEESGENAATPTLKLEMI